jgi:hypothetical protein
MSANNGAEHDEVLFSLDALEPPDTKPPFTFEAGGRTWLIGNPDDIDFRAQERIAEADTNAAFLRELLGDQYADFAALDIKLPAWKFEKLFGAISDYYGISPPESLASSVSSNRAARRSRPTSGRTTASGSRTSARSG